MVDKELEINAKNAEKWSLKSHVEVQTQILVWSDFSGTRGLWSDFSDRLKMAKFERLA